MSARLSRTLRIVPAAIVFLAGMTIGGEVLLLAMRVQLSVLPVLLAALFSATFLLLAWLLFNATHPASGGETVHAVSRRETYELVAVCAYCRKVLDDGCSWLPFEEYLRRHSSMRCSHGICPDCVSKVSP